MDQVKIRMAGSTVDPPDMMEAARKSLDAEGFDELMCETRGAAPTADQLVAKVEARRVAS
jgi:hypothetical protein